MRSIVPTLFPPNSRILTLPNRNRPRLYLTSYSVRQRWQHSGFFPAFRWTARAHRTAQRLRAALGVAPTCQSPNLTWALGEFLNDLWPDLESAVVMMGSEGPAQKLTVQLWQGTQTVAYVKYAELPAARVRLAQEAKILLALPAGVGPQIVRYSEFAAGEALVTTPVLGRMLPTHPHPSEGAMAYLNGLRISGELTISAHPWVLELQEAFGNKVEQWLEPLASSKWPVVLTHGDFTPWNVLQSPSASITAIDWEYGSISGFPYLDALHWTLQVAALLRKASPVQAHDRAMRFIGRELPASQAKALISLAAFKAYQEAFADGVSPDVSLQTWRRHVWQVE